jgi:hypothetical protein
VRLEEEGGFLMVVRRLGGVSGLGLGLNRQLVADVRVDEIGCSEDLMARIHVVMLLHIWDAGLALHLLYRLINWVIRMLVVFMSRRINVERGRGDLICNAEMLLLFMLRYLLGPRMFKRL